MVRVLLVGDSDGIAQSLRHFPKDSIIGIICASIRPQYFDKIEKISKFMNIPMLIQPLKRDADLYREFIEKLDTINFDIIFINSYSMKLHADILVKAEKGAFNVHGGLLPEYRGCSPVQWAIINKEIKSGVTLHEVTEEIDCGPIIAKTEVEIGEFATWIEVTENINLETEYILATYVPLILTGEYTSKPQNNRTGKTWPRRNPSDGKIPVTSPVIDIYNSSRALAYPLPGIILTSEENSDLFYDRYLTLAEIFSIKSKFMKNLISMKSPHGEIVYTSPLIFDELHKSHFLAAEHGELSFSLMQYDNTETGRAHLFDISLYNRSAKLRFELLENGTNDSTLNLLDFLKNLLVHELSLNSLLINEITN
jgi:methionyl-tRNA formyltransferase